MITQNLKKNLGMQYFILIRNLKELKDLLLTSDASRDLYYLLEEIIKDGAF